MIQEAKSENSSAHNSSLLSKSVISSNGSSVSGQEHKSNESRSRGNLAFGSQGSNESQGVNLKQEEKQNIFKTNNEGAMQPIEEEKIEENHQKLSIEQNP